jgi:signal transduction histidine kinase
MPPSTEIRIMEVEQIEDVIPETILGLGVLFSLVALAEGLYLLFISNPLGMLWVAGFVTSLPFTLGIVYIGVWLPGSSTSPSRFKRIWSWCFGGLCVFLMINIIIMLTMPPDSSLRLISWERWAATLGAGIGLLVGIFQARSIEQAVQVERERVRAEEAEATEDTLAYLNAKLRHEVLNTAQVIVGRADHIVAEYDGNGTIPEHMETIQSSCQQMESVIEDVRLLLQATRNQCDVEQNDIVDLLATEIDTLQSTHQEVSITTSLPEQAVARANDPLRSAFANLLWNAVEHNDSETPRVEVTVRREATKVVVQIADNGPGIPRAERDTLFEPEIRSDDNHGLGLALTHTLVDHYEGNLEVTETGPDGTVFTLTIPRASESVPDRENSTGQPTNTQSDP